jgi:DNA-binding MarR family transcriptional regulator
MSPSPAERRQRRNRSQDLLGKMMTQTGPRTTAPMWVRPLLTVGEWAVYTALWSYPSDSVFPTHQDLADRAWCERGTAADAIARFDELGLLVREANQRDDGSDTSNTYYLIEVPTKMHLADAAAAKAKREAEQEEKRRKRKARNRSYERSTAKKDVDHMPCEGGTAQEVPPGEGGTVQEVPPGYGTDRTLGYGEGRTHEVPLGVTEGSKGTVRTTPSSSAKAHQNRAEPDQEQKTAIPSEPQNQEPTPETAEDVKAKEFWPELTEWEVALRDEVLAVPSTLWTSSPVTKVLGSRTVRELTERDPELVRRAFLIGAADAKTLPMRMWHVDRCPHWKRAAAELAAERGGQAAATEPAAPELVRAPSQRQQIPVAGPVVSGSEHPEVLAWREQNAAKLAARRSAEDQAEQDRVARHAARLAEAAGVPV